MRAPWVLKVGHRDITVERLSLVDGLDQGLQGCFSNRHSRISITDGYPLQEQAATLWHEIIHACYECFGLPDRPLDQEGVCEALERPLATVIRDNPKLLQRLQDALTKGVPLV